MLSYILRRIWQMLPTLLGVILLIFFLFKFFGGDPVEIMAGMKASPERLASLRAQLGLDKSVMEQLWVFVQQVFTFNWGRSWTTNEAISDIFATRLPATLTIMIPILILEVLLAIGAFSLSLLGTFLVRSGVLTSVHAFATDPRRGIFILMLLVVVIAKILTQLNSMHHYHTSHKTELLHLKIIKQLLSITIQTLKLFLFGVVKIMILLFTVKHLFALNLKKPLN